MRKLLVLLLLTLIAVKVAAVLARGPVSIERDALGYWRLSTLVMSGDIWMISEPIAYRTPAYPWFLAAVRSFAGSQALGCVAIIQAVLSVLTIVIAGHIAARITKLPRAMAWTLLISLPAVSALTFNAAVLSESLFTFLLMLNLLAVLDYGRSSTPGRAIWVGITFALALLTRPIIALLWVVHILFVLWVHARRRRRVGKDAPRRLKLYGRFAHFALAAITVLFLVAPWLARNEYLFDKPLLTEFVGRNLWVVTFQDGSGAGLELPKTSESEQLQARLARVGVTEGWRQTWTVSNALVRSGMNDAQADRLMHHVAIQAIEPNHAAFATLAAKRAVNFWRTAATELPLQDDPSANLQRQYTWSYELAPVQWAIDHRLSLSVRMNTLIAGLIFASTLVLMINGPSRPYGFWFLLILAYFAVVTGIFEIPAYRYRMVIEPLAAAACGAAISVLLSRRRKPAAVASV